MREYELSPSLLSADFGYVMRDVESITPYCSFLHLDVMDGHYVPNLTIGVPVIKSIRKHSDLILDTHLMITNPGEFVEPFAAAGSDYITFHVECSDKPFELIEKIRGLGKKAGVAIHPDTPAEAIYPFLEKGAADLILVMSVRPGFGGQSYIPESTARIADYRKRLDENGSDAILSVDGGINVSTVAEAAEAGAKLLVAGSAVFGKEDPGLAAKELYSLIGVSL
ncbi:MAG: ribulose-phosphate 3-epimerase [Clostridiales bacterium]|nr:ribulose-phosphate 3-epimerase [Clostridiales bacterium]